MVKVKNTNTRTKPIKLRNRWAKQYRDNTYRNAIRSSTSMGGKKTAKRRHKRRQRKNKRTRRRR